MNCLAIGAIGNNTPYVSFDSSRWVIPPNIQLADPRFSISAPIDLLLGADVFWKILQNQKHKIVPGVFARKTKLGWILTGRIPRLNPQLISQCHLTTVKSDPDLERFWDIEDCQLLSSKLTREDTVCIVAFGISLSC